MLLYNSHQHYEILLKLTPTVTSWNRPCLLVWLHRSYFQSV